MIKDIKRHMLVMEASPCMSNPNGEGVPNKVPQILVKPSNLSPEEKAVTLENALGRAGAIPFEADPLPDTVDDLAAQERENYKSIIAALADGNPRPIKFWVSVGCIDVASLNNPSIGLVDELVDYLRIESDVFDSEWRALAVACKAVGDAKARLVDCIDTITPSHTTGCETALLLVSKPGESMEAKLALAKQINRP